MKIALISLILGFATFAVAAEKDVEVPVKGMVCSFCAQGITKKFKSEPSVSKVDVSLEKKVVTVRLKEGKELADSKIERP